MKLRAVVTEATGKVKHSAGEFIEGTPIPINSLSVPAWIEISEEGGAFYLFHYDTDGICFADTWHQSLEEAKRQAEFEFGIAANEWTPVIPEGTPP